MRRTKKFGSWCVFGIIFEASCSSQSLKIWLFNPSIRLSHAHPNPYILAKTGVTQVAKVLYKLIGPSETISPNGFVLACQTTSESLLTHAVSSLQVTNPDFAQAEHLYYPMSICHSLAVFLRESNRTYPPACRTMNGLDIAWLEKA